MTLEGIGLDMLEYPESDLYAFVRRKGVPFVSAPLTSDERAIVDAAADAGKWLRAECCFQNAQRVLLRDTKARLVYVEGDVLWEGLERPMRHAWLALGGKVIDPTDMPTDGSASIPRLTCGEFPAERKYFGVRIGRAYVLARVKEWAVAVCSGRKGLTPSLLPDIVERGLTGWEHVPR